MDEGVGFKKMQFLRSGGRQQIYNDEENIFIKKFHLKATTERLRKGGGKFQ